jgi:uncharacterized membrane protein
VAVGAIIGFASSIGNPVLAGGACLQAWLVLYLAQKTVNGVVEDEMNFHIGHLAPPSQLKLLLICFAAVGSILISMRNIYPQYMGSWLFPCLCKLSYCIALCNPLLVLQQEIRGVDEEQN